MRWRIRKSFKIFAAGSSLRKRVAYSMAIVRLILVPVIFLAVYYLFVMGRIVDRIVNVDAPAAKLAEQASIEILEARRAARNYVLLQDPEYLQTNQKSLTNARQVLVRIGELEPGDETIVQQSLEELTLYEQRFAATVSAMAESRQEPVERIRQVVLAYEKGLDDLLRPSSSNSMEVEKSWNLPRASKTSPPCCGESDRTRCDKSGLLIKNRTHSAAEVRRGKLAAHELKQNDFRRRQLYRRAAGPLQ